MDDSRGMSPPERTGWVRILDANLNRAAEGLRTVEEYVRFVLDDRHLTQHCKQLRHDLAGLFADLSARERLAARETLRDVGTTISVAAEGQRAGLDDVWQANLQRVCQSLRCLEEYGKLLSPELGAAVESLRYRVYTLQRAIQGTAHGLERLAAARLYVLIDGRADEGAFRTLVAGLIEAGVGVLQLRDKNLPDRLLLQRARQLRELTRGQSSLCIINDRPDIARLAEADGVHVGQDELPVKDARAIVGPGRLIGVSTHSLPQARQAVLDGADYIGCGPTFPSGTKHFADFPGLRLLEDVRREIRLPAFAIGGIGRDNLDQVLRAGFDRVAVSGAVLQAPDPADEARRLVEALGARPTSQVSADG